MVYRGRHYSESSSDSQARSLSRSRSHHHHSHSHSSRKTNESRERSENYERSKLGHHQMDSERRYRSRSNSYNEPKRRSSGGFDFEDGDDQDGFAVDFSENVSQKQQPSLLQTTNTPPIHSIQKGTIRKVLDFGSFVKIPGYSFDGLIHVDQYIPDSPSPKEGDSVFVKVLKVFESDGKLKMSLSLKECNQKTGKDLNPSNKHDEGYFADDGGIHIGSIRKTVCSRCGMKGHMDWECFVDLKNKDLYTLVSDEEEVKEEKHKHKHKHRHHHHHH